MTRETDELNRVADIFGVNPADFAFRYGSAYRPLSPLWVRIEGLEYGNDFIIVDGDGSPTGYHSVLYAVTPLSEEKVSSLELIELGGGHDNI